MMHHRRFASIHVLPAAFALLAAGCMGPVREAGPAPQRVGEARLALGCSPRQPVVNLGDLSLVFAPNVGQGPGGPPILGIALGAGALSIDADGVRLDLAAVTGPRPSPEATVVIRHGGAAAPFAVDASSLLSSTTSYVTADGATTGVANYGAASANIAPGIVATLDGTLRKLATHYEVRPGAKPSSIQWSYQGATSVTVDPVVGSLSIAVAGGARTLSLGPPSAHQLVNGATVSVSAHYLVKNGVVGLSLGAYDPTLPLHITTELLHSRFFDASGTAAIDGATYAVGASLRVTGSPVSTGRDAYVASLDPATGELASTVFLVGDGDDEAVAVAPSSSGVLVAGGTTSQAFAAKGGAPPPNAGQHDAFVVRLSASGEVIAGTLLGTSADEIATGVVETATGAVAIAGTASAAPAPLNAKDADFTTVMLTAEASPENRAYFVSALDGSLAAPLYVVPLSGPPLRRPRAFTNCLGTLTVGVPALESSLDCDTWPELTYSMHQYGQDYAQDHDWSSGDPNLGYPPGGWGYHAHRWRYFENAPTYGLSFAPIFPNVPKMASPMTSDAALLSSEELTAFTPSDPPGAWMAGTTGYVEDLAIVSAFGEWFYGSPVYTHEKDRLPDGTPYTYPVAVETTTFDVCVDASGTTYAGQGLDTLCNFAGSWVGNTSCPGISGADYYVVVKNFEMSTWNPNLTWFMEHVNHDPFPQSWYDEWYDPGTFVCDPPDEEPQGAAQLEEIASRLAGLMARDVVAATTVYTGGVPASPATGPITVRLSDLR